MEVQLLGGVAVTDHGELVTVEAPLARRCLAALALSSGPVTLDRLADALWGDDVPVNWKQALRNVVAKLRQRLEPIGGGGGALVVTAPIGYRLASGCTVDVYNALGSADAADAALADGDPDRALELAMSALDQLGEPLLPDIDADWSTGYRTRTEWAHTRSLQVAAAASRAVGRLAQSIDLAARAIEENPLAEESHRQLITSHAAAGDRAAALRAYETCRRTLATELGVSPDPATTDLHLGILGTEPARPTRSRQAGPLFGRTDELATLRREVAVGVVVTVSGPGGIGKSRLAAEFAADVDNGFDGVATIVDAEGLSDDSQMITALTTLLGITGGGDDAAEKVQRELAGRGPTLLVIDGADRVVDATANLIVTLTNSCPNTALLITCRVPIGLDIEVPLGLAPLDHDAGQAWFIACAPDVIDVSSEAARDSIAAVCRAVGGIPLGIELAARQSADVSLADLADRVGGRALDAEGNPPPLLDDVVESTVALLDDDEIEVFRRLSAISGPVDLALVEASVADERVRAGRVVRILAVLAERGLVRLDRSSVRWMYDQHPVLRRAGRDLLAPADLRHVNDRLAAALFARLPSTATEPPRVAQVTALLPAIRGYLDAALDKAADPATGLRLAYWLHRFWAASAVDEGQQWLARLLDAAPEESVDRGPAEFALGYLLLWSGRPVDATEHLEAATRLLDTPHRLRPAAHYYLANAAENRNPELARQHYRAAIDTAAGAGLAGTAARWAIGLATVEFEAGERDVGLHRYEEALSAIESPGDDDAVVVVLPQYAGMLISVKRFEEAHAVLQRVEQNVGDEVRITTMIAAAIRARLERHRGRLDVARRHARRAAAMIEQAGVGRLDGLASPTLALGDLAAGDTDAAVAELVRGAKAAIGSEQLAILADILDAATLVGIALGRADNASAVYAATQRLRQRSQVIRGDPEQAELDAALGGHTAGRPDEVDGDIDLSQITDLVAGMAAS